MNWKSSTLGDFQGDGYPFTTHFNTAMRLSQLRILLLCLMILSPHVMAQHNPERLLFRRTDNLPGADFTGALPTNVDQEAPFGELDDPASSLISALDVDREPGTAEIDLLGDNYDLAFIFQFYDEDGVFSFTENLSLIHI